MTNSIKILNHSDVALDRFTQVFKEKPNISGFIRALVDQIQILEFVNHDLCDLRHVYSATGVQLDGVGSIVGETRNGRNDDEYRVAILARIAINTSDGTPEEFITIFKLITGATQVFYQPVFPASVYAMVNINIDQTTENDGADSFSFDGGLDGLGFSDLFNPTIGGKFAGIVFKDINDIYLILDGVLPAGVRLDYIGWYDDRGPFGFEGDTNNSGFGDVNDSTIGGNFAKVSPHTLPFSLRSDSILTRGLGDLNDFLVGGLFTSL